MGTSGEYDPYRQSMDVTVRKTAKMEGGGPLQLRVDDAAAREPAPNHAEHGALVSSPSPSQPSVILSRSLSRSSRPPSLHLKKSNGATAAPPPLQPPLQPPLPPPPSTVPSAAPPSQLHPPPPPDRPLPALPPGASTSAIEQTMGNKNSKLSASDQERARNASVGPNRHLLKRRPLNGPTSTLAHSSSNATTVKSAPFGKANQNKASNLHHSTSARDLSSQLQPQHLSDNTQSTPATTQIQSTPINNTSSQHLPPTPPSDDVTEANQTLPGTPPAKPNLLPALRLVPSESPSKYGLAKMKSADDIKSMLKEKTSKHHRGKSSTALNIFKTNSKNQKPSAITSPPASQPPSPSRSRNSEAEPRASYHKQSSSDSRLLLSSEFGSLPKLGDWTSTKFRSGAADDNTSLTDRSVDHPSTPPPSSLYKGPKLSSILQTRPNRTNAPRLSIVQEQCFHEHRHFRVSKNIEAPVACMLCFVESDITGHGPYGPIAAERWSCVWCALRICKPCRKKVDELYGRRARKSLVLGGMGYGGESSGERMNNQNRNRAGTNTTIGRTIGRLGTPPVRGPQMSMDDTPRGRRSSMSVDTLRDSSYNGGRRRSSGALESGDFGPMMKTMRTPSSLSVVHVD
ncbi:hypothetical protein K402DRAFT_70371 [Aulographum hederae CBS 113979]|uniref:Uncharacterized protein n=1 Tax=Aulographum hederae CBS 113979 TaxID=1176131 RepID=A0A6G1HF13_9PEZI|nr:hypothetical protein K402DRAFT_70371 [Aulographum hederae CBS 113979]